MDFIDALLQPQILMGIVGLVMGVASCQIWGVLSNMGNFFYVRVYQLRNGIRFEVKEQHVKAGDSEFSVGQNTYINDPTGIDAYKKNHGIQEFIEGHSKPLRTKVVITETSSKEPGETITESIGALSITSEKPHSAFAYIHFKMKGLKQMMSATGAPQMGMILLVIVAVVGLMAGYMIFTVVHFGYVSAPPPGYEYTLKQIPYNQ